MLVINPAFGSSNNPAVVEVDMDNLGSFTLFTDNTVAVADSNGLFGAPSAMIANLGANVAYVYNRDYSNIVSVDLISGARTIVADNSVPDADNTFIEPVAFAIDELQGELLVLDGGRDSLVAVDMASGARRVVSAPGVPDFDNPLSEPRALVLDRNNQNRVMVVDRGREALIAIDLTTGARSMFSAEGSVSWQPWDAESIAIDTFRQQFLLIDGDTVLKTVDFNGNVSSTGVSAYNDVNFDSTTNHAVLVTERNNLQSYYGSRIATVFLDTNTLSLAAQSNVPNANASMDNPLYSATHLSTGEIFVVDQNLDAIIGVDGATGSRRIVSDNNIAVGQSNIDFLNPRGITIDSAGNRAFVTDVSQNALIAIDLVTGARTLVSNNDMAVAQSNVNIGSPWNLAYDLANDRLLVAQQTNLIAVDVASGVRMLVADNQTATAISTIDFRFLTGIALDIDKNRALIADFWADAVIAVDLVSGARTVLFDWNDISGWGSPMGVSINPANGQVVIASTHDRLVLFDLATDVYEEIQISHLSRFGARVEDISLSLNGEWVYALDIRMGSLLAVDIKTGEAVLFSQ